VVSGGMSAARLSVSIDAVDIAPRTTGLASRADGRRQLYLTADHDVYSYATADELDDLAERLMLLAHELRAEQTSAVAA